MQTFAILDKKSMEIIKPDILYEKTYICNEVKICIMHCGSLVFK